MIGFESHVRGNITVTEALQVRHQVSLPVLLVLAIFALTAFFAVSRPVYPPSDRWIIVGCKREANLCIIFDTATGHQALSQMPQYPGASPAQES